MTASVIHIGLDAAEPDLVESLAASGRMPRVAELMGRSTTVPLRTAEDLPGAMWPELATGRFGARSGVYFPPAQIINGSGAQLRMTPEYLDSDSWFWQIASRAGRRVMSIDMVHAALTPCDAFEIVEYGSHDRMIAPTGSSPEEALAQLIADHGEYPVHSCDTFHKGTQRGYRRLRDQLLIGAERKGQLAAAVVGREAWDLSSVVFTETHCACHQLWHFHDETNARHPRRTTPMASSVAEVYGAVDAGVGRVLDAAGPDARVVLTAIKGASNSVGGPHLVSDVLAALELTRPRGWKGRVWDEVPALIKGQLSRIPLETRAVLGVGTEPGGRDAEGKARALRNDQTGAVRIHVKGRDPGGTIEPGEQATAVLGLIEQTFRGLRDKATGQPIVRDVRRIFDHYGDRAHPDLPDLVIIFNRDVGLLEHVVSDRFETLRRPFNRIRTGDHTGNGRAWISAPEAVDGVSETREVCDVPATLLELCGVAAPATYDGTAKGIVDV